MKRKALQKPVKKERLIALIILIISSIACIFIIGHTVYNTTKSSNKMNKLKIGTLNLTFDDVNGSVVNLTSAVPVTDNEGLTGTKYTFTLKNTGDNNSQYRIKLINDKSTYLKDGCSNNKLNWSNIKYSLKKNNATPIIKILSDTSGIIDSGILKAKESNTYSLQLWIKSSVTNEIIGQHLHALIQIE